MIRKKGMESFSGRVEEFIRGIGRKGSSMGKGSILMRVGLFLKGNGVMGRSVNNIEWCMG